MTLSQLTWEYRAFGLASADAVAEAVDGQGNLDQPISQGYARAGKVTLEEELIRGPETNCRLGDFRMDNEEIVICIQGESTFSQFSFWGEYR